LSTDNGDSWAVAASGLSNKTVKSMTSIGNNTFAGTLGSGIFLSSDNGSSWKSVNTGLTNSNINALITTGSTVFAGTSAGVFISTDQGSMWSSINKGLTTTNIASLATDGTNLYAGTYGGGMFLSTDNGSSWRVVNSGLGSDSINTILVNGSNVFAGTNSNGIYMSSDNGSNWQSVSSGLTNAHIWSMVASGSHIFAGTGGGGKHNGTGGGTGGGKGRGGVFLLNNNGVSWIPENNGLPKTDVRSLYISGLYLIAGTADSNVWKQPLSSLISGIPDTKTVKSDLHIYPNPVLENINVQFNAKSKTVVVIYNALGEMVCKETWLPGESDQHVINASVWKKGIYFLSIGSQVEKFIKN
jgi:ligand-binding sensor domain-containing protein